MEIRLIKDRRKDNYNGIPKSIGIRYAAILQYQANGEGTGLNLSLSENIIKVHRGKEVVTIEAEGDGIYYAVTC